MKRSENYTSARLQLSQWLRISLGCTQAVLAVAVGIAADAAGATTTAAPATSSVSSPTLADDPETEILTARIGIKANPAKAAAELLMLSSKRNVRTNVAATRHLYQVLLPLLQELAKNDELEQQIKVFRAFCDSTGDADSTLYLLLFEAISYERARKPALARKTFNASLEYYLTHSFSEDAYRLASASIFFKDRGELARALEFSLAALDSLKAAKTGGDEKRALVLGQIGKINFQLRLYDRAKANYLEALAIANRLGNQALVADVMINLGNIAKDSSQIAQARDYYNNAIHHSELAHLEGYKLIALLNIATIQLESGQARQCLSSTALARVITPYASAPEFKAALDTTEGACLIATGSQVLGKRKFDEGLQFFVQNNNDRVVSETYELLAKAYQSVGAYEQATGALLKQIGASQHLYATDAQRVAIDSETEFEARALEKNVALLQTENIKKGQELRTKERLKWFAYILAMAVIVTATLITLLANRYRRLAVKSNRDKSVFLAEAAHDLKQPMQGLSNQLEALEHYVRRRNFAKSQELITSAIQAADSMRALFTEIMELCRLESGFVSAHYSLFSLKAVITNELCFVRQTAEKHGVSLTLKVGGNSDYVVKSDQVLISRVIRNLISNAIKFSQPARVAHPRVLISLRNRRQHCELLVIDNGIGIDESQISHIYAPFFRELSESGQTAEGFGLGLAVVKSIIGLLNGHDVLVASRKGHGTRFTIRLPLGSPPASE